MIVFSILAIILFLWNLSINNQLRLLKQETETLKEEIESAAKTCGTSLN